MIVTIDGPAGSGKSTVATSLAKKLGFVHLNSGSLYRAITAFLLNNKQELSNIDTTENLPKLTLRIEFIDGVQHVFVNEIDQTKFLRENEISIWTPKVSVNPKIRCIVDDCQRDFALKHNTIVEGRDTGSFVFPNADKKFYLDCSIDERTRRRLVEERIKGNDISFDVLKQQIFERDETDKHKKYAPLVIPKNATIIDSTNLTIAEVVDAIANELN